MQALDDQIETIHLYVVREAEKRPYTASPLFCAFLCLLGIVVLTLYSTEHPYYEHKRITVPAQFLPIKVFTAEAPIIPTGLKTYPATYAHGFLTFSNGSVIGQSVPEGFTIDGAVIGDILPRLKRGGFLLSLRGFPASLRLAWLGFHRTGSYGLSTGSNRKSCGQHIFCCIDITIMLDATFRAYP